MTQNLSQLYQGRGTLIMLNVMYKNEVVSCLLCATETGSQGAWREPVSRRIDLCDHSGGRLWKNEPY